MRATYEKKEELLSQRVAKVREEYFRGRKDQRDNYMDARAAGPTSAVTEARALIDMMKQDMEKFESLKVEARASGVPHDCFSLLMNLIIF